MVTVVELIYRRARIEPQVSPTPENTLSNCTRAGHSGWRCQMQQIDRNKKRRQPVKVEFQIKMTFLKVLQLCPKYCVGYTYIKMIPCLCEIKFH